MGKQIKKIAVINYSHDPGPRYVRQGESSGEDFYHKVLNNSFYEAINNGEILQISLDGTSGYASSFLDEAFGNLIYDFTLEFVRENLIIISEEEPEWKDMLMNQSFAEWEKRRLDLRKPTKTTEHPAWYKLIDNEYKSNVWVVA